MKSLWVVNRIIKNNEKPPDRVKIKIFKKIEILKKDKIKLVKNIEKIKIYSP